MSDEFYVEDGYVDSAYFEIIVDSGVIAITPYFAEDYTDIDYVDNNGSFFLLLANTDVVIEEAAAIIASAGTLTAVVGTLESADAGLSVIANTAIDIEKFAGVDAAIISEFAQTATPFRILEGGASIDSAMTATITTIAFINHDADLASAFIQTAEVNVQTDTSGLLEYIADLNAQAAKITDITASFGIDTNMGDNTGGLGTSVDANATFEGASILTITASINAIPTNLVISDTIELNSAFSITADAIEYQLRPNPYTRPNNWYVNSGSYSFAPDNTIGGFVFPTAGSTVSKLISDPINFYPTNSQGGFLTFTYRKTSEDNQGSITLLSYGDSNRGFKITESEGAGSYRILTLTIYGSTATRTLTPNNSLEKNRIAFNSNNWIQVVVRIRNGSALFRFRQLTNTSPFTVLASDTVSGSIGNLLEPVNKTILLTSTKNYTSPVFGESIAGINYADFALYESDNLQLLTNYGLAPSLTSYTEFPNDLDETIIYTPFETDLLDKTGIIFEVSANLNSVFSQTATINGLSQGAASLNSAFVQTAQPNRIVQFSSDFDAVASQLIAAAKVADFFVNADIIAGFDISEDLFKGFAADISANATQTAVAVKTVDAVISLTGAFTPTIETDGFKRFAADLISNSTLDATVNRIQPGAADLSTVFSQVADVVTIIDSAADLSSEFTQGNTDYIRFRSADANLEAAGAQLTAIAKTAGFFINADVTTTLTVDGVVRAGVVVEEMVNTVTIAVTGNRIRFADSSMSIVAEQTAEAVLVTDIEVALGSEFAQTADFARTRGVETDFDAIATQLSVIGKIAPYTAGLEVNTNLTAQVNAVRDSDADINSAASASITATRIKPLSAAISSLTELSGTLSITIGGDANLTANTSLTVTGVIKVFNLDQYIYRIPRETRNHIITEENRSHTITGDSRIYTIEGS